MNPEILIWARETAGFDLREAADKTRLNKDRLAELERGEIHPNHSELLKMAEAYWRPVLTFYLADIPQQSDYGADFRGLAKGATAREESLVAALLRSTKTSQELIRVTLELEEEIIPLPFVGLLRRNWSLPVETASLECVLRQMPGEEYERFVQDGLNGLDLVLGDQFGRENYYAKPNARAAFNLLRSFCERAGIFVILKGDLGSYHSKVPTKLFRAFVIADEIAPYIVINSHDSPSARSFSVLHEVVHLLLDQSGISDASESSPIEQFCNQVAGEWLLPSETLRAIWGQSRASSQEVKDSISAIAREYHLSHTYGGREALPEQSD